MHALDTMRALANQAEVLTLRAGEVLFEAGDVGTSMYGLLEGSIRLTWIDDQGLEGTEDIPQGHVFGAGAVVMDGHRRLGTATAMVESRLIEMNRDKFLFAVQESPMFAIELLASVDGRLRDLKQADP